MSYYRPYESETESETESEYTTDSDESIPGGNYTPIQTGVAMSVTESGMGATTTNTGTKFEMTETRNTFLFTINSRDRDTRIYPQPTNFSIRLPRTLKNVRQINISQISLLNSFFNFDISKGNTFMYVLESGRTRIENGSTIDNSVKIAIRNGTYNADDLVVELTNALNTTPLFSDITYADFITLFRTTGDYTLLFNSPGQIVYNSLTQSYDRNQTINNIVARYFQIVQTVGTVSYTDNQMLVAYYYPIIKEMLVTQPDPIPFSLGNMELPPDFANWYDYLVFAFKGLDDPYVLTICQDPNNITIFNRYRSQTTFNQFLVNKYACTYNNKQGRLVISATSLNDSITTDLNTEYSNILGSLVVQNGFPSVTDFQNKYNAIQSINGSLTEYYNFIQQNFAKYFGVSFGKYADVFYADSNNQIDIYNINNRFGWNLNTQMDLFQIQSNTAATQSDRLWSNITVPINTSTINMVSTITIPEFGASNTLFFSNSGESTYGYTDIVFRLPATSYIRASFNTVCRQNISLMTIPRYIGDRGSETNMKYDLSPVGTPYLYDIPNGSTMFIRFDISGNPLFNMYDLSGSMFASANYMRAFNEWLNYMSPQFLFGSRIQSDNPVFGQKPSIVDISLTSFRPYIFFQFNAPAYLIEPQAHFDMDLYVETQDGTVFPVPILITWYKDRAAFMTDAALDLVGQISDENPRHYFKRQQYVNTNSAVMTVDVSNYQSTYFMIHLDSTDNLPSSIPLRIFVVLSGTYGVYRQSTILDTYDMPWVGLTGLADQFTPENSTFRNPLGFIYDNSITQIGTDISGVSNNWLDYIIQANNSNYYDPKTVTPYIDGSRTGMRYLYQQRTDGSKTPDPSISTPNTWSLYFGSNSSNYIRDTYNTSNNVYLGPQGVPKPMPTGQKNEHLLVNWYGPYSNVKEEYMQPAPNGSIYTRISTTSIFLPCVNIAAPLTTDVSTNTSFLDTTGVCGVSFFLPIDSIVRMDSLMFKYVYTQPSATQSNVSFTRQNTSLNDSSQMFNTNFYRNQATTTKTTTSPVNDWDDWYLYNRRNLKIGLFRTADISGADISLLSLSSAIMSMTLDKVTQINSYQDLLGAKRTREPAWGTYYTYHFDSNVSIRWDVANVNYTSTISSAAHWRSTIVEADFAPTYISGNTSYPHHFYTVPGINNCSYLQRSYGIAPSVGTSVDYPLSSNDWTTDIAHSFTAVPFYFNSNTSNWSVGSMFGLSYTTSPLLPDSQKMGAAPYYGPPGIFAWSPVGSTISLYNGSQTSFRPYYWNTKVTFEMLGIDYNPATDLTAFGGYAGVQTEYQDTVLFFYDNSNAPGNDYKDISTTTFTSNYWQWGQESASNYTAWDDQSGYNFLSYIHDINVRPTTDEYAVHVRAYDPIPEFTTGLRFIGKNYTDFGRPTLMEIAYEISTLAGYQPISDISGNAFLSDPIGFSTIVNNNNAIREAGRFSHEYADALIRFDVAFSTTQTFGRKLGYKGATFSTVSYSNALTDYIGFRSTTRGSLILYTNILSTATGQLNEYIIERYSNILPPSIISRNRATDPLPFQLLFGSKTEEPYKSLPDEWGLGWNLGFSKRDTVPRTSVTSDTFIRISQDYIYLRLNPELNMNGLAVSGKENLAETRISAAEDGKYFAKILLANFGGFSRAAVQLPKLFNPVLGKYETVICQLVDRFGNIINNTDCDYDFVLECTEISQGPKDTTSLVLPNTINQDDLIVYQSGGVPLSK